MACLKSRKIGKKGGNGRSSLLNKVLANSVVLSSTPRNVDIFDKTEIGFFTGYSTAAEPNCLGVVFESSSPLACDHFDSFSPFRTWEKRA